MTKYLLALAGLAVASSSFAVGPVNNEVEFANVSNVPVCVYINDKLTKKVESDKVVRIKVDAKGKYSVTASEAAGKSGACSQDKLDAPGEFCKLSPKYVAVVGKEQEKPKSEPKEVCSPSAPIPSL